jgi:hypothetical protein
MIARELAHEQVHGRRAQRKHDEREADEEALHPEDVQEREVDQLEKRRVPDEGPVAELGSAQRAMLVQLDDRAAAVAKAIPAEEPEHEPVHEERVQEPHAEQRVAVAVQEVGKPLGAHAAAV